jgi:hypothetical protein
MRAQNRKNNTSNNVFLRINHYTTPNDVNIVKFYKDYSYHEQGDTKANTRIHSKSDVDYDTFKAAFKQIILSSEYPGDFYDNWGQRQGYLAYHAKWKGGVSPAKQGERVRERLDEFKRIYDAIPTSRKLEILGEAVKAEQQINDIQNPPPPTTTTTTTTDKAPETTKKEDTEKTMSDYIEEYWWLAGVVVVIFIVVLTIK